MIVARRASCGTWRSAVISTRAELTRSMRAAASARYAAV